MIRKIAIAAALIWAFTIALDRVDLDQASTVANHAQATQLAELD